MIKFQFERKGTRILIAHLGCRLLMRAIFLCCFKIFLFLSAFAQDAADGLRPVSSGLAPGVVRFRSPLSYSRGNTGFTKGGSRQETGFEAERLSQTFVVDANVFQNLTAFVQVPYVYRDQVALNADMFRKSSFYESQYSRLVERLADELNAQGLCLNRANCRSLIENGYALQADRVAQITEEEALTLKAGVPLRSYVDSVVINAVQPEAGNVGLGDFEVGFLYSFMDLKATTQPSKDFGVALGSYLRIPNSNNELVPRSKRALGFGSTDLGFRLGLDYLPEKHTLISLLVSAETQLTHGKRRPSLATDGRRLAPGSSETWRRVGLRQGAFLKVEYNLAGINEAWVPLSTELRFKYSLEPEVRLGADRQTASIAAQSALAGLRFEQLTADSWLPSLVPGVSFLPWAVGLLYEYPLLSSGDNVFVAVSTLSVFLELYYQF